MTSENHETQLARIIYHRMLSTMKFTLDLEEQKYLEKGRLDDRYKFFKKQLMSQTYDNLRSLFKDLEALKLLEPTSYPEDVKDGYKPTSSGGSGYANAQSLDKWLNSVHE
ncbi:MAG TPA: hypothetical protein ENH82_16270 [bacterium]|nr:hypothetical protein [bacterium]